jgi:peptidoglycan/LPS O-acetylase OafA/YrhL
LTTATSRPQSLPSLTGLRFVAAVAVFGYHFTYWLTAGSSRQWLLPVFGRGATGVGLFFVLSGFVLAWSRRDDERPTITYRRRFARIYPAYVLAWAIAAGVQAFVGVRLLVGTGLLNLALVQAWVPRSTVYWGWNGVAWSLSCEAFFYALFPLLVIGLVRLSSASRRRLCVALVVVIAAGSIAANWLTPAGLPLNSSLGVFGWLIYICPLGRLPEFVLGMLLALEAEQGRLPRIPVTVAFVAFVWAYHETAALRHLASQTGVMVLPIMVLVVSLAQADVRQARWRPLSARSMVYAGECSYSFYLLHAMLLSAYSHERPAMSSVSAALGVAAALLVVTTIMSAGVHRAVEMPLGARLRRRRPAPPAIPSQARRAEVDSPLRIG